MTRSRVRWLLVTFAALAILLVLARPFLAGLSFVVPPANLQGVARRAADFEAQPWSEREATAESARTSTHGRLYEPARTVNRAVVLISGLHPAGIDEPRLVGLARQLAASGLAVFTPDIAELSHFEI